MAILQNGPNGAIVGKFGSVSAYLLKGQNVVRGGKKKNERLRRVRPNF